MVNHFRNNKLLLLATGIIFLLGSIIILSVLLPPRDAWYPQGWDAGFYMSQAKRLLSGEVSFFDVGLLRSGYIIVSTIFAKITGASIQTVEIMFPSLLLVLIAAISFFIVYRITRLPGLALIAAVFHLFSPSLIRMTQSLSANLLALAVLYFLVFSFLQWYHRPKIIIPIIISALGIIGSVHMETLFFTIGFLLLAGALLVISHPPKTTNSLTIRYFFLVPIIICILGLLILPTSASIGGLLQGYIQKTNLTSLFTDRPLAIEQIVAGVTSGVQFSTADILSGLGIVAILLFFKRKNEVWVFYLTAWTGITILLLSLSKGQATFVFERTLLIWPSSMLAMVGLVSLMRRIGAVVVRNIFLAVVMLSSVFSGISYAQSNRAWFPYSIAQQLSEINTQITPFEQESWDILVYISDNSSAVNNSTYSLWADNVGANFSVEFTKRACMFGLTLEEYHGLWSNGSPKPVFTIIPGTRVDCPRSPSGNVIIIDPLYKGLETEQFKKIVRRAFSPVHSENATVLRMKR